MDTINIDAEKIRIERDRLVLEEKRLRFEQSLPRKWGPLIIGFLLPFTTWVGGMQISAWEKERQDGISARATQERAALAEREKTQQEAEKDRQNARLDREREVSSARTTLELYFKHSDLMDSSKPAAFENLSMLAEISGLKSVRDILMRMSEKLISADRTAARRNGEEPKEPHELLQGVPDLVKPTKGSASSLYDLSKFTAYLQAPTARQNDPAVKSALGNVRGVLKGMGLRAPDTEFVKAVPDQNEIRIYLPEHRAFAEDMARKFSTETGQPFVVKELAKTGLPDGVLEIWMKN
jgi:hypothetical protein